MIDPTKTLAVCEAATGGPWETWCDFDGYTDPEPEVIQSGHEDDRYSVVIASEVMQSNGADATFIAQARTELPAYAAFVRDVLALLNGAPMMPQAEISKLAAKYEIGVEG